jgi:hypothetical protein
MTVEEEEKDGWMSGGSRERKEVFGRKKERPLLVGVLQLWRRVVWDNLSGQLPTAAREVRWWCCAVCVRVRGEAGQAMTRGTGVGTCNQLLRRSN